MTNDFRDFDLRINSSTILLECIKNAQFETPSNQENENWNKTKVIYQKKNIAFQNVSSSK